MKGPSSTDGMHKRAKGVPNITVPAGLPYTPGKPPQPPRGPIVDRLKVGLPLGPVRWGPGGVLMYRLVGFCFTVFLMQRMVTLEQPDKLKIFRQGCAAYTLMIVLLSVSYNESLWGALDSERWYHFFFFLTSWSYLATTAYFALVAGACEPVLEMGGFSPLLCGGLTLASRVWQVATTYSLLSTIVFWPAIFKKERYSHRDDGLAVDSMFLTINSHGISLLLLLADHAQAVSSGAALPFSMRAGLIWSLAFGAVYQLFVIIVHQFEGRWLYEFLNPAKPRANIAVYTVVVVCFGVVNCIVYLESQKRENFGWWH